MPITPFHLGPGFLLELGVRGTFNAFLVVNVVIDVESGYHLLAGAHPVHTFLHTFVGATIVAVAALVLLGAIEHWYRVHRRFLKEQPTTLRSETPYPSIAVGAVAGAWSHVVLDGIMHADVRPFAPWSDANPFYRVIGVLALHGVCVGFALVALYIFIRLWGRVNC